MLVPYHDRRRVVAGNCEEAPPALPAGWTACPNLSDWWPGDIVLIRSSITAGKAPPLISTLQRKLGIPNEDSLWTHAAIHCGAGELLECVPAGGVTCGNVFSYLENRAVMVRRVDKVTSEDLGRQVVTWAHKVLGAPYDWKRIIEIAADRLASTTPEANPLSADRGFLCSTLCEYAVAGAVNLGLNDNSNNRECKVLLPGHLAGHNRLITVTTCWRPVCQR